MDSVKIVHSPLDSDSLFQFQKFSNDQSLETGFAICESQVLDEPTNHLDLQTVEALGEALKAGS